MSHYETMRLVVVGVALVLAGCGVTIPKPWEVEPDARIPFGEGESASRVTEAPTAPTPDVSTVVTDDEPSTVNDSVANPVSPITQASEPDDSDSIKSGTSWYLINQSWYEGQIGQFYESEYGLWSKFRVLSPNGEVKCEYELDSDYVTLQQMKCESDVSDGGQRTGSQSGGMTRAFGPAKEMWDVVKNSSHPDDLKNFLRKYSNVDYAPAAWERLHQLESETWEVVKKELIEPSDQENFRQAYLGLRDFLKTYPRGKYDEAAKQLMSQLERKAERASSGCKDVGSLEVCSTWRNGKLGIQTCREKISNGDRPHVFCPQGIESVILYNTIVNDGML